MPYFAGSGHGNISNRVTVFPILLLLFFFVQFFELKFKFFIEF